MSFFVRSLLFLAILATAAGSQTAPPTPPADQLQRANQLFLSGDWRATLSAYEALSNAFPNHALSRFRIGVAQLELGQLEAAETNLREGERLGVTPGMAAFRLAQVHAKQGRNDKAFAELERAAAAQLGVPTPVLDTMKHLAPLKRDPRWAKAADQLDVFARPCLHDTRHREFDFWIGDWDVRPTGQPPVGPAARNTVTLEYNGCIIVEHWNPGNGAGGESYNLYDRSIGKWRQTWVDAFGGQHDYTGNLKDGNMAYEGTVPAPPGQRGRVPARLTFFRIGNDSVRQLGESTPDSGRTWQTSYDLMYVRRK